MKNKTIIWSLFDSETAITQELNNDEYEVYSIGLPSSSALTNNFIKIDLSRKSCIKKLLKLPSPDIIFASPPCEMWISLSIGNVRYYERNYNEYNLYWQKNFKPNDFDKNHREKRLLGQKTAYWTYKIIEMFKPKMWCIENGASSLIFRYLHRYFGMIGYRNRLNYNSYNDEFSKKPTIIFSNKKMTLNNNNNNSSNNKISVSKRDLDKVRKNGEWERLGFLSPSAYIHSKYNYITTYAERSKVPLELYQHILRYYEGKEQLTMF